MKTQTEPKRPWARMIMELMRRKIALVRERGGVPQAEDSLVHRWAGCEITERHTLAVSVEASDDELEAVAPELQECLRNDPPRLRRRVLRAVTSTHRRIAELAVEARP